MHEYPLVYGMHILKKTISQITQDTPSPVQIIISLEWSPLIFFQLVNSSLCISL